MERGNGGLTAINAYTHETSQRRLDTIVFCIDDLNNRDERRALHWCA